MSEQQRVKGDNHMDQDLELLRQSERSRRARRRKLNGKHKLRDRYKPRGTFRVICFPRSTWRHDPFELDVTFNRQKAAPETGYGVAWEHRSDVG